MSKQGEVQVNHQRNPNQVSFLHYHYLAGFGNPNNDLNPRQRPNNLFPDNRNNNVAYRDDDRSSETSSPSWNYERNRPPVREVTPDDSSEEFQNPFYDEVP